MRLFHKPTKAQALVNFILVSSSFCAVYLIISVLLLGPSRLALVSKTSQDVSTATTLDHLVFGIASSTSSWAKRKEYVKLWWNNAASKAVKGCVFVESLTDEEHAGNENDTCLPPLCVSQDTSRFRYTHKGGLRSAIRVARVVAETVALNNGSDVRWYVFGDDDTVFFPENVAKALSKYDHELWYYIGAHSEVYEQNRLFGFGMAFGGAGFAISSSLAKVLAKVFDSCIERYSHLYGSDGRVYSCLAELGVGLTHEPGFHQVDLRGNTFGLLAAHPLTPLLSLHHPDYTDPIFPNMTTTKALKHLFEAVNVDSQRVLQQAICYDRWFSWTISVSWGYAVQVFPNHMLLPDVLKVQETFKQWRKGNMLAKTYTFNTREFHPDPCKRSTVFFLDSASSGKDGIISSYKKSFQNCSNDAESPMKLEVIKVVTNKLDLDIKQLQAPRRHCCDVLPSTARDKMEIAIRECKDDELVYMH
ncbi:DNA polymerase eta [Spatholobus suberectus]|nr:DNA polymerase eta [Spatholobus suberectus]